MRWRSVRHPPIHLRWDVLEYEVRRVSADAAGAAARTTPAFAHNVQCVPVHYRLEVLRRDVRYVRGRHVLQLRCGQLRMPMKRAPRLSQLHSIIYPSTDSNALPSDARAACRRVPGIHMTLPGGGPESVRTAAPPNPLHQP